MLFKVEVSDVNVNKNWRNYGVKKATDDVAVITEFISKYNIKVFIFAFIFMNSDQLWSCKGQY